MYKVYLDRRGLIKLNGMCAFKAYSLLFNYTADNPGTWSGTRRQEFVFEVEELLLCIPVCFEEWIAVSNTGHKIINSSSLN